MTSSSPALRTAPRGLEARGVVLLRGDRRLLDGVDLRVGPGDVAVIEGPSGCGKSTLLRALATLLPVDGGAILLDGVDAAAIPPTLFRRRVAYVPQLPPMLEGTVADNVATGPRLRGVELPAATIDALLERAALPTGLQERPARELSGGEKQRVALARALANEPEVLLLDEPTSALDPVSAAQILDLVRALAAAGTAIVAVTHVDGHARSLGGRIYACEAGKLTLKDGA